MGFCANYKITAVMMRLHPEGAGVFTKVSFQTLGDASITITCDF